MLAVASGLRKPSNFWTLRQMGDRGLEPLTSCVSSRRSSQLS